MKDLFRVHTADNKIKYTGTIEGSWFFTLESARAKCDRSKGEKVYRWFNEITPMFEIC